VPSPPKILVCSPFLGLYPCSVRICDHTIGDQHAHFSGSSLPISLPAVDVAVTQPIATASSLDLNRPVTSQEVSQIDEQPALPKLNGNQAPTSNFVRAEPVRINRPRAKSIAETDNAIASIAEGRRLHIGNVAYGTTDADFQAFFEGYPV
jgi:hypothetical protein